MMCRTRRFPWKMAMRARGWEGKVAIHDIEPLLRFAAEHYSCLGLHLVVGNTEHRHYQHRYNTRTDRISIIHKER